MKKLLLSLILLSSSGSLMAADGGGYKSERDLFPEATAAENAYRAAVIARDAELVARYGTHIAGVDIRHRGGQRQFDTIRDLLLDDKTEQLIKVLDIWEQHGGMIRSHVEDLLTIARALGKVKAAERLAKFLDTEGATF